MATIAAPGWNNEAIRISLPGEDRDFGGSKLYVEIIPASTGGKNLRYMMSFTEWRKLREYVIERAHFKCEICFALEKLECHERWDFDIVSGVQRLKRLVCLCKPCHFVSHFEFASTQMSDTVELAHHALRVNNWTIEELESHRESRLIAYKDLSERVWKIDLTIAKNVGLKFHNPKLVDEYKYIKRHNLNKECKLRIFIPYYSREHSQGYRVDLSKIYRAKRTTKANFERTMSLDKFLKAFKNRIYVSNRTELELQLAKQGRPRRLVVPFMEISELRSLASERLKSNVLFSRPVQGEHNVATFPELQLPFVG